MLVQLVKNYLTDIPPRSVIQNLSNWERQNIPQFSSQQHKQEVIQPLQSLQQQNIYPQLQQQDVFSQILP
ncbi:unnamed protein product [Rhizophagus irregularis]|nr:unnamed protein product [Rhizophagus irregularis]